MDEITLVKQLKAGDKDAFNSLYEKYKNMLLRMAYLVCGSMDDAEDIVQEAFVKCYLHIGEIKNPAGFRPWLFQIMYRTAYRLSRKSRREIPDEDIGTRLEATDGITSLDKVIRTETEKIITDAVWELDIKHRAVVVMYYYNEMTTREIAKVLSCTEGTVKSRLFASRKKLKGTLEFVQEGGVVI